MSAEIKNRPQDLWGIAIRECWDKGVLEQGSVGTREYEARSGRRRTKFDFTDQRISKFMKK